MKIAGTLQYKEENISIDILHQKKFGVTFSVKLILYNR